MKNAPLIAASATILLHAGLLAAAIAGLTVQQKPDEPPETLQVQLIAPAPLPVAQPAPLQPVTPPTPAKKEREPIPRAEPKPAQRATATVPAHVPEATPDPKPSPAIAQPSPQAPAPAAPATATPTAPASPARTSASEASYAATNRKPPYPRVALSNGDEGTVILRVLVTAEGTAGTVEVKSSSGHSLLDESARRTVQTWRFKPATVDGKPVTEWYQVPIPFTLQNN